MSAFIVNDETINNVLSYLKLGKDTEWLRRRIEQYGYKLQDDEDYEQFGGKLYLMNVAAVDERYNEANDSVKILQEFRFCIGGAKTLTGRQALTITTIQAYKSAKCLRYQCSEGDVPETNLYKCLETIIQALADRIIDYSPAYDAAKWD